MIKRYTDFLFKESYSNNSKLILENVQQAKDFLRKLEIQRRKEQGIDAKLTEEEIKAVEKNPYFIKIKDMLTQTTGLTYLFTKTFFKDWKNQWEGSEYEMDRCIEDLKTIYNDLMSRRDLWGLLPMPFDKYASLEPDEKDHRPSIERLTDDWREVLASQNGKQLFLNRLLPFQKKWFKDAPESIMKKVSSIGDAFAQFGMKDDGSIDQSENKMMNDDFFIKFRSGKRVEYIARFQTLGELLKGAEEYINTASKNSYKYVRDKIEEANRKCGHENGVDIIWEDRGLMVVEIKSFTSNAIVNANTSHCIKNSLGTWNSYVSLEQLRRQYYIYNFNLPSSDSKSVIGVTIDRTGKAIYAHAKRDEAFLRDLYPYMKQNRIPEDTLEPYSPEEQKNIIKRLDANKSLRSEGADYETIKDALERGGDVNVDGGLPLKNAVMRGDLESVKLLIDSGAKVNLKNDLVDRLNQKVSPERNLEIVSILIANGFEINQASYRSIINQLKGVSIFSIIKVMLASGMDPNVMDGRMFRDGIARKDVEWVEQLSKFNLNFAARDYMLLLTLIQQGEGPDANKGEFKTELLDISLSKLREIKDTIFKDDEKRRKILVRWLFDANYFVSEGEDSVKAKRIKILLNKLEEYGASSDIKYISDYCKKEISSYKSSSEDYKYLDAIIKELSK